MLMRRPYPKARLISRHRERCLPPPSFPIGQPRANHAGGHRGVSDQASIFCQHQILSFKILFYSVFGVGILARKDQEAKYDKNTLANFQFMFHFHFLLNSNFELPHFAFKSFRLSAGGDITALVDLISRHVGDFPGFYSKWPCQS